MATTSTSTQGITITVEDGTGTPVTITGHVGISGFGSGSSKEIDITTMASTAKEFRQGLRDFGGLKIDLVRNPDDAGQAELFSMQELQATREFVITAPTGTLNVYTFSGFVSQFTTDMATDDVLRGSCTVRVTGAPTIT